MSDGWRDYRERSITNFLVNSPKGTVFLKSINTSNISKNAKNLFQLLDSLVQEIGEENVVQVVTDSASAYVLAGEKLMEKRRKIFWNPCAAHCIDLMLHDIGDLPNTSNISKNAKNLFQLLDSLVQEIGEENVVQVVTDSASAYVLAGEKLMEKRRKIFWNPCAAHCIDLMLHDIVLRLVDGDAKPAMGYIYEAIDRAKGFHYVPNFDASEEVRLGLYEVIERMYPTTLERCRIDLQLEKFDKAEGLFGKKNGYSYKNKEAVRQIKREENGDSYDSICLLDMESDDEWITEKEEPCLPEDTSWMDIHECFEVNEEG
nr:uncharacterized protein LOC112025432 [Quercus suber]